MVCVRRNFGVCALFLEIHPELKQFVCPKLGEDQKKKKKKALTKKCSDYCVLNYVKTKKRSSALEQYLCPKSLLSALLLSFYYQQPFVCATICLCAANLCVCAVSEICMRAHTRTAFREHWRLLTKRSSNAERPHIDLIKI